MRAAARLVGVSGLLAAAWASPACALKTTPCRGIRGFGCAVLRVPLDRGVQLPTQPGPGLDRTIGLRVAVQDSRAARRKPVLVSLSGGPGQEGVAFARSAAQTLKPLLGRYRLAVLDQRGTGRSGALSCPTLQRESELAAVVPEQLAACAQSIGARRAFFTTADSVADLDALRAALGAGKLALQGVSYGTYVAVQYARTHPDRTDRLVLDSVLPPGGIDVFSLDTFGALPRVLAETCRAGRCARATSNPSGDLAAAVAAAQAGTLRGRFVDADGRPRTGSLDPSALLGLLLAGDLNPFEQAALPGALAAAANGDAAPLLRLQRVANGPPTTTRELSVGLNVITDCEDATLPYSLASPVGPDRDAAVQAALAQIAPDARGSFSPDAVLALSLAHDCLQWPQTSSGVESTAPLPDVPTLVLSGRFDLRTPLADAKATASQLPRASFVAVPGDGHDEIDSDITGCVARALTRFAHDRSVGDPCRGHTDQVSPTRRPPLALSAYPERALPGRVVDAVADTLDDAETSYLQAVFGGVKAHGGGLRGGRWRRARKMLVLSRDTYVPGLRVSGRYSVAGHRGRITFTGPPGAGGHIDYTPKGGSGVVGGHHVSLRRGSAARAGAFEHELPAGPPRDPQVQRRLRRR